MSSSGDLWNLSFLVTSRRRCLTDGCANVIVKGSVWEWGEGEGERVRLAHGCGRIGGEIYIEQGLKRPTAECRRMVSFM